MQTQIATIAAATLVETVTVADLARAALRAAEIHRNSLSWDNALYGLTYEEAASKACDEIGIIDPSIRALAKCLALNGEALTMARRIAG